MHHSRCYNQVNINSNFPNNPSAVGENSSNPNANLSGFNRCTIQNRTRFNHCLLQIQVLLSVAFILFSEWHFLLLE